MSNIDETMIDYHIRQIIKIATHERQILTDTNNFVLNCIDFSKTYDVIMGRSGLSNSLTLPHPHPRRGMGGLGLMILLKLAIPHHLHP